MKLDRDYALVMIGFGSLWAWLAGGAMLAQWEAGDLTWMAAITTFWFGLPGVAMSAIGLVSLLRGQR